MGALYRRGAHRGELSAGLPSPHHRYADGRPVGRGGRGGGARIMAPGRQRGGMSATEAAIAKPAAVAPGSPRLSALVVAHNEEAQLAECLSRLAFADEIVIDPHGCDDRSSDI